MYINETVSFNAVNSHDPDGDEMMYEWYVDDRSCSNKEIFRYAFTDTIEHWVKLVVTDEKGKKNDVCIQIQAKKK